MPTAILLCLVTAITDGDTIRVRCPEEPVQVVRLAEIDAPERRQPWGDRSRQHLAELCHEMKAEIRPQTRDRYGRTVARVTCAGQDASVVQVQAGMAWAFTKYLTDKSFSASEAQARAAGRGLWADPTPVAPWKWRRPAEVRASPAADRPLVLAPTEN